MCLIDEGLNLGLGAKGGSACKRSPAQHGKTSEPRGSPHLSVIQVTEPPDDLLLVQLVGFELHASDGLHGAVILEALLPRKLRLLRGAILETVQVAFLPAKRGFPRWTRFLPLLIGNITYLDVEGDLRGEVSEGAGNDHPGALRSTAASKDSLGSEMKASAPQRKGGCGLARSSPLRDGTSLYTSLTTQLQ